MLEVCSGLQTEGRKMGDTRGPVGLWSEGPRVMGALLCAKYLSVCSRFEPGESSSLVFGELMKP